MGINVIADSFAVGYLATNGQPRAAEVIQPPQAQAVVLINAIAGEQYAWVSTPDGDFDNLASPIKSVPLVCNKNVQP